MSTPGLAAVAAASDDAFVAGFHASSVVGAAVALLGAIVAATALTPRKSRDRDRAMEQRYAPR